MARLRDKMTFLGDDFDILVADFTRVYSDRPWTAAAHPDFGVGSMKSTVSNTETWTTAMHRLVGSCTIMEDVDNLTVCRTST